ncbi:MAG: DUF2290 domain-containing protein [Flavobacterium sp.]|jgi:hypothetical protein|nr:DUF2290 domain-containing protein [Flavobacterium sp.]
MISEATFNISITHSIKLLKEIKLFKGVGPKNIGEYSDEFKKVCRKNKHVEIYNTIRDNLDYEIILSDESFFQFSYKADYLRFSYIQNPRFKFTKYDYVKICFPEDDLDILSEEEIDGLINESEYEQFLIEQEINSNLVYVRYDFDKAGYNPLLHSCSHIHIGLNENLRIPSSIVLTPLEFVLFAVKQCYYDVWSLYHEKLTPANVSVKLSNSKKRCVAITDQNIWNPIEQNQIYIT